MPSHSAVSFLATSKTSLLSGTPAGRFDRRDGEGFAAAGGHSVGSLCPTRGSLCHGSFGGRWLVPGKHDHASHRARLSAGAPHGTDRVMPRKRARDPRPPLLPYRPLASRQPATFLAHHASRTGGVLIPAATRSGSTEPTTLSILNPVNSACISRMCRYDSSRKGQFRRPARPAECNLRSGLECGLTGHPGAVVWFDLRRPLLGQQ